VGGLPGHGAVVRDRTFLAIAFRRKTCFGDTFSDEIIFHHLSPSFGKRQVPGGVARIVGVSFDSQVQLRMIDQDGGQLVERGERSVHQLVTGRIEQDIVSDEIDFFGRLFFNDRRGEGATVIRKGSRTIRTLIFFIIQSVAIPVGNGASMIAGQARNGPAAVVLVIYSVMIGVWDRAAIVARQTGNGPAGIVVVIHAIAIGVGCRTAAPGRGTGLQRTIVHIVGDPVVVRIPFRFRKRGASG